MSANLAIGQIIRATAWTVDGSQGAANTWFYQVTNIGSPGALDQDFCTNLDAAIAPLYKAILNNNASYRGVQAQIVFPLPVLTDVQQIGNAGVGTGGSVSMAKQVTGITSWYTHLAGPAGRGRTYWPFPATAFDTGDGVPTAGYVTAVDALAAAIINFSAVSLGGRTATVSPGVYNRSTHAINLMTVRFTRSLWATQRRRGAYGRPNISPI